MSSLVRRKSLFETTLFLGTDPLPHETACGLFAARAPGRMVCQSFVAWIKTAASVTCPPPRAVERLSLSRLKIRRFLVR